MSVFPTEPKKRTKKKKPNRTPWKHIGKQAWRDAVSKGHTDSRKLKDMSLLQDCINRHGNDPVHIIEETGWDLKKFAQVARDLIQLKEVTGESIGKIVGKTIGEVAETETGIPLLGEIGEEVGRKVGKAIGEQLKPKKKV